jgi:glycosyltransferase involved in cell wall biosynthesis
MACGLPAVATDIGDARLIVGDTGLVVTPQSSAALAAAIRILAAESASLRAERGRRARERIVENFSMRHTVQHHVALYESLAANRQ